MKNKAPRKTYSFVRRIYGSGKKYTNILKITALKYNKKIWNTNTIHFKNHVFIQILALDALGNRIQYEQKVQYQPKMNPRARKENINSK